MKQKCQWVDDTHALLATREASTHDQKLLFVAAMEACRHDLPYGLVRVLNGSAVKIR
jgi:hypothetical protein